MNATNLVSGVNTAPQLNGEVSGARHLALDELVAAIVRDGKPVTVWQAAMRLGDGFAGQVSSAFHELTAEGTLAEFRVGFINYYAPPRVALTGKGPTLGTIILDSLKGPFLSCKYRLMGKLRGLNGCSPPR